MINLIEFKARVREALDAMTGVTEQATEEEWLELLAEVFYTENEVNGKKKKAT